MDERIIKGLLSIILISSVAGCTSSRQIPALYTNDGRIDLSLPGNYIDENSGNAVASQVFHEVVREEEHEGPSLMDASETDKDGEPIIRDSIKTSRITARFSNTGERMGMVDIEFIIHASASLLDGASQLRLYPKLTYLQDTLLLDRVFFTKKAYRDWQNEGYARYEKYCSSIVKDSTAFLRRGMIDCFMSRNGRFVDEKEAADHYVRWSKRTFNYRLTEKEPEMFMRFVQCPIETEQIRVDSIFSRVKGDEVCYTYKYSLKTLPKMKKVCVHLDGEIFDASGNIYEISSPEPLTYYVSSLAMLVRRGQLSGLPSEAELYASGLQMIEDMEYEKAAEVLRPFKDYNTALALLGEFKNYSALQILNSLASAPDVEYLRAIAYMRLQREDYALKCYEKACRGNKFYISRGNLDQEIKTLKMNKHIEDSALYE